MNNKSKNIIGIKKELWLSGKIVHDHRFLGKGKIVEYNINDGIWAPINKEYSRSFWKENNQDINEYINYVKDKLHGDCIIKKEERDVILDEYNWTLSDYDPFVELCYENKNSQYSSFFDNYRKRKVIDVIVYTQKRKGFNITKYCTDWEHYDPETNTDTRDSGIVTCEPSYKDISDLAKKYSTNNIYNKEKCDCLMCNRENKNHNYKNDLKDYQLLYNSGTSIEDLYDIF